MLGDLKDLLRRVVNLEHAVKELKDKVHDHDLADAEIKGEIVNLSQQFEVVKNDILHQITTFTSNTWKLIFALVAIIAILVGVKDVPLKL